MGWIGENPWISFTLDPDKDKCEVCGKAATVIVATPNGAHRYCEGHRP